MTASMTRSNGAARTPERAGTAVVADDETVQAPTGGRRRRVDVPQILVAVLLVVGCALGAVVWSAASTDREPVLALDRPIQRGEVLTDDALRIVNIDTDVDIAVVPASSVGNFVGAVATADLEAGSLVSPGDFAVEAVLGVGEAVVGAALGPGEYPVAGLRPGDRVDAYLMPTATNSPETAVDTIEIAEILAADIEVFDVAVGSNDVLVSLRVPEDLAGGVAAAADMDRLRLVLVGDPGGEGSG